MSQFVDIIVIVFRIYRYILIARILMSWVPGMERTSVGSILYRLTEPYLAVFRRFIPSVGMMDFSPIVALLALYMIEQGIFAILNSVL